MSKKKTSKTAAKRVKITAHGRLKYRQPGRGHLLGGKSRKLKRQMRKNAVIHHSDEKRIRTMLET